MAISDRNKPEPIIFAGPALVQLSKRLNILCDAQEFRTAFAIRNLITGQEVLRDADVVTASASTRKILFLVTALAAVADGRIALDDEVTYTPELAEGPVSGILYFLTPGLKLPFRDALVLMIILSDNVCTSLVGDRLGVEMINAQARRIGMDNTLIREIVPPRHMPPEADFDFVGQTTPSDQIRLLQAILDGTTSSEAADRIGLTPDLCAYAIKVMGQQQYRQRIPGLLPRNTFVASKTGTGRQGTMDAGIVYHDGKPLYVIAVYASELSKRLSNGEDGHVTADSVIAKLSRFTWDEFTL